MRILINIAALGRGGAERQVVQLAAGLRARGHDCVLVANKTVTAYHDELDAAGLQTVSFGRMSRYDPRVLTDLLVLFRRMRPDVVLAVSFNATLWGRLAAVLLRLPVVTAEHSSSARVSSYVRWTNKLLAPWTKAVVACGRGQVPQVVAGGNRERSVVVIRNGVDAGEYRPDPAAGAAFREELGIPRDALVVGLVAAHRPEKRHDRFITLIRGLRDRGLDVWGCMVGGGPLLDETRGAVARSSAAGRLIVAGARSDVCAAYNALDLVALVSNNEAFPLTLLEAQACGKPVVVMGEGTVSETFLDGVSGLLVAQGDEQRLLDEVAELIADADRLRQMGEAGRAWVRATLTIDAMVSAYEELLSRVAKC